VVDRDLYVLLGSCRKMGKQASGMHFDVICSREVRATPVKSSGQASVQLAQNRGVCSSRLMPEAYVYPVVGGVEHGTTEGGIIHREDRPTKRISSMKLMEQRIMQQESRLIRKIV
jgi:hypothetical protein